MLDKVRLEGAGQPYLIQHSAGSGKTNTIAWATHSLIRVRRPDGEPYFHSVIVVTDRQVLDKQLQDAITQIEHQSGVIKAVDRETSSQSKSEQLAQAMLSGTPYHRLHAANLPVRPKSHPQGNQPAQPPLCHHH